MSDLLHEHVPARTGVEQGAPAGRASGRNHRGMATGKHLRERAGAAAMVLIRAAGHRTSGGGGLGLSQLVRQVVAGERDEGHPCGGRKRSTRGVDDKQLVEAGCGQDPVDVPLVADQP